METRHQTLWETARTDTPSCQSIIHLNNAGSSLPPVTTVKAQVDYLQEEARIGGYELAAYRKAEIDGFKSVLASLFGGRPDQYAWATSATDAYNRALSSIPFVEGDVILTSRNDYVSNYIAFLQLARQKGVRLVTVPDYPYGGVDFRAFNRLIRKHKPRLVAISHVPSHTGLIQQVEDIGGQCRHAGCLYLVDGCQSAGQLPIDMEAIGCDFFSSTFRKFLRGPRGAGFLYVSDRVLKSDMEPLFLDLHSAEWTAPDQYRALNDARRYELWERSYASVVGAKAALEYLQAMGQERVSGRVMELSQYTRERLLYMDEVELIYPAAPSSGIFTAYVPGKDPRELLHALRAEKVHLSIAWSDAARIGMEEKRHPWGLRFSPHYYNTGAEIDAALDLLGKLLKGL